MIVEVNTQDTLSFYIEFVMSKLSHEKILSGCLSSRQHIALLYMPVHVYPF